MDQINVCITGVGGGIGRAVVELLSQKTNVKVFAYSRNPEKLKPGFNEHPNVVLGRMDLNEIVSNAETINSLDLPNKIDILINNAGFLNKKAFEQYASFEIQQIVNVNFTGTLLFTKACLPALRNSNQAHVVNISSMGGVQGSMKFPGLTVYAASKAAICGFTEVLAEEYKSTGIHVNCIALGAVETKMFNEAFPGQKAPQKPDQTAKYIVDFALNQREYFNGKIIQLAATTP